MAGMSTTLADLRRRHDSASESEVHSEGLAAQLGVMLGVAFCLCLITGVISHLHQHPVSWLTLPATPAGLYRITQGVHVIVGLASIPLLLGKLYVLSPKLVRWPLADDLVDAMARLALLPLVGGSVLLLFSGAANIASWYPWDFFFPVGHWWAAWMVLGALIVHVALQFPVARAAFGARRLRTPGGVADSATTTGAVEPGRSMTRRGLLAAVGSAVGVITLLTAGQTVPALRSFTALAPRRPDIGPQGFPVNRTAQAAGTEALAIDGNYRLSVVSADGRRHEFEIDEIRSLEQVDHDLPIACVEGWSASVSWRGVPLRSVLEAAGLRAADIEGRSVKVGSAQRRGLYGSSIVEAHVASRGDCLLALAANGEPLHPDHGAPLRLIAPNRPGVLQTKWVTQLEVL